MSTDTPHTMATFVPVWQRKSALIMLAVLAALAIFGTTTQTWIHVFIAPGETTQSEINIPGSKAAVAVSALALVALAGALATSIAGKIARIITELVVAFTVRSATSSVPSSGEIVPSSRINFTCACPSASPSASRS